MCLSKDNSARSANKKLFTQPQNNFLPPTAAKLFLPAVIRGLFGNRDIMRMALPDTGIGNPHKLGFFL